MTAAASIYSNVILEKPYDPQSLEQILKESVNWAEAKLKELSIKLSELYPSRKIKSN